MKRRAPRRFRVRFSETFWYLIDLKARNEQDAVDRARELFLHRTSAAADSAPRGFRLDLTDGSLDNFEAIPINTKGDPS